MSPFQPVAKALTADRNTINIRFADGHKAIFEGYQNVRNSKESSIRSFKLLRGGTLIIEYRGQETFRTYCTRPSKTEHYFDYVAKDCSREQVVAYWEAAASFVDDEYNVAIHDYSIEDLRKMIANVSKKRLPAVLAEILPAFDVTQASLQDLTYIKENLVPFPNGR